MAIGNINCGNSVVTDKAVQELILQWNIFCAAVNAANGTGNTLAAALIAGGSNPISTLTNSPTIQPVIPDLP